MPDLSGLFFILLSEENIFLNLWHTLEHSSKGMYSAPYRRKEGTSPAPCGCAPSVPCPCSRASCHTKCSSKEAADQRLCQSCWCRLRNWAKITLKASEIWALQVLKKNKRPSPHAAPLAPPYISPESTRGTCQGEERQLNICHFLSALTSSRFLASW